MSCWFSRLALTDLLMGALRWLNLVFLMAFVADAAPPRIGILTMHSPNILDYANYTADVNRAYAKHWGYGFHVVDHIIDSKRVPIWSKLLAIPIWLPEYDYLFWIDADAVFYDTTRSIQDVIDIAAETHVDIWVAGAWAEYPSVIRNEHIDTSTVLFRNSLWTRTLLAELYHFPGCLDEIQLGDQYCFVVGHRANFMNMQERVKIIPSPTLNHYLPASPSSGVESLYILHMSGKPDAVRAAHFQQFWSGRRETFRSDDVFKPFWSFYEVYTTFADLAGQHTCVFGLGARNYDFFDAMLYHFPYHAGFVWVKYGSPGVSSSLRKHHSEMKPLFPGRTLVLEVQDLEIEEMSRLHCDIFLLGIESYRHVNKSDLFYRLAWNGLRPSGGMANSSLMSMATSPEVTFAISFAGCIGDTRKVDADDKDGTELIAACTYMAELREELAAFAGLGTQSTPLVSVMRVRRTALPNPDVANLASYDTELSQSWLNRDADSSEKRGKSLKRR